MPEAVVQRTKQPYRAPDAECFFGRRRSARRREYVDELLSPRADRATTGSSSPRRSSSWSTRPARGDAIGVKDNMALVGILSTQLVVEQFIRNSAAVRRLRDGADPCSRDDVLAGDDRPSTVTRRT